MTDVADDTLVTTLVTDRLYRLGGLARLDGSISWVPREATGFEPINCYLLKSDSSALLVDTGVEAHQDIVLEQLAACLAPDVELQVMLTRLEPDCIGNLGAIAERYEVTRVYGGGVSNPFDFFDDVNSAEMIRSGS